MTYEWHRIFSRAEMENEALPMNKVRTVEAGNKKLYLGRLESGYYAIDDKCPHAGGSLGQGNCDSRGNVICPYHRHGFKLKDGLPASGKGYYVNSYPVEERPDGLYAGIPKKRGLFAWLSGD
jgi:3-phenylpropionate/trans-cinnamate dioxygenase ferredoxin subunit